MVKFIDTIGSSNYLADLIKGAKDNLILINPSFQFTETIKEQLISLSNQNRKVTLVLDEDTLQSEETNWLQSLIGIKTSFRKNLQSRCYLNENEAIITSTGLFDFSEQNNADMGIYISKEKDKNLYASTLAEVNELLKLSYN
ncbi:MAG: hypothetical protein EOP00_21415 [Pedobacter sp.]|nr:MAG: hypothetical protein EOP00_21415 [Pedobacter sp.]